MKRTRILLLLLILTAVSGAYAQHSDKKKLANRKLTLGNLAGTWSLVTVENILPDSSKVQPYGVNPQGLLVFDVNGTYAIQILKAVRPAVAANDKNKATPEENAALVQGNNSHFGTYEVDAANQILTFRIERAFYPNWEGTIQKRSYTLNRSELKYIVTNTTNGGAITAVVIWKRKI